MSNDFDWLDDDYGLDQESDRVIENVEIPRSEWMEPETYRSWLSNGGAEL